MPTHGASTKSDERRRAVVAAAIDCFARKGFYGTTTDEIAEAVGISQPYLYRLYSKKQALFAAAVDHVSVDMTGTLAVQPAGIGFSREPLIERAVCRSYATQVDAVRQPLDNDAEVRRWFGAGMLDNVVAVLGLAELDEPWARTLSDR
ncbi:TetR/AcrR family transcriptional regulator [Pseudonocardia sp. ICBG1293]|uniref:TetR/AcrR family transcriptional regulator n=1 Tax=Pseudonocardia sp. ICBG1293 TaxID=2844382 RepID=UPI001CCED722|nr:TetR/AcrR family transcriptional regulator [Pseudonocardia sp. ICBG1293]